MADKRLRKLKDRASDAMRRGKHRAALDALEELERLAPEDPAWPRRMADVYRRVANKQGELDALQRAAGRYADLGLVIQAVATCKLILSLDPGHSATQRRLAELNAERGITLPPYPTRDSDDVSQETSEDAPLDELLLTDVVSDALPAHLGEQLEEGISEIPLDANASPDDLDLALSDGVIPELVESDASESDSISGPLDFDPALVEGPDPGAELRRTPLFGSLDADALGHLIDRVRLVDIAEGEVLFRQGDPADSLYVVVDGAVVPIADASALSPEPTRLAVLEAGAFFGEIGLVTNQPRNATIQALVDTRLLVIDRRVMWKLIREHPPVFKELLRFLRERLVDRLVRTSPFFAAFARAERSDLAAHFRFLEVRDGTAVVEQGRLASGLFVVLSGQLDVILMDCDGDKNLATLHPGDVCGERSLLQSEAAMASVVATGKAWLLVLDGERFGRILDRNPRLQEVIQRISEERERENSTTLRQAVRDGKENLGLV